MGADDYVAKPFKVKPLISRIKALLRRTTATSGSQDVVAIHGIEIDRTKHSVTLDGSELLLTPTEQLKSLGEAETVGAYSEALTRLFGLADEIEAEREGLVEPFTRPKNRASR